MGTLPAADRVEVLECLLQKLSPAALQTVSPEVMALLRDVPRARVSIGDNQRVDSRLSCKFRARSVAVDLGRESVLTAVPDETLNRSRHDQTVIADRCGGRIATRSENLAVAKALIARESQSFVSEKDADLLRVYRNGYVRDDQGGVFIEDWRVLDYNGLSGLPSPEIGALVVAS